MRVPVSGNACATVRELQPVKTTFEPSFDATTFTKNRERFLQFDLGQQLFDEVLGRAHERDLRSDEQAEAFLKSRAEPVEVIRSRFVSSAVADALRQKIAKSAAPSS